MTKSPLAEEIVDEWWRYAIPAYNYCFKAEKEKLEELISAGLATAERQRDELLAAGEARPNIQQEDEIVGIVNQRVAADWATFSEGEPPKVTAPQVRYTIEAWAAIARARSGGSGDTNDNVD